MKNSNSTKIEIQKKSVPRSMDGQASDIKMMGEVIHEDSEPNTGIILPMATRLVSEKRLTGQPILIGPCGTQAQVLQRVNLTPKGNGDFDEAWLQRLIHEHPTCLPIEEIEAGLDEFVAICREMPTPVGYVDNLLMTGNGDIVIVEAKLFRNPEARRKVLSQALDYATSLFSMGYEAFEKCVLDGIFAPAAKPTSLYAILPEANKLEEAAFIDAVSRNLRRGRALVLIAGDGIRTEAASLLDGLNNHARLGFTLALVELGVFHMPNKGYLVRPRTLAKTEIVSRTIVEVTGSGASVREEPVTRTETLSANSYWADLESKVPGSRQALEQLIAAVEPMGVYSEFLRALNFKLARPEGKPLNLGYIMRHGALWIDAAFWGTTPADLATAYARELAALFNCELKPPSQSATSLTLYKDGKPLRLGAVLGQLGQWPAIMGRFIAAIQRHEANESA